MAGVRTLASGFLRSAERFPDRPAIEFDRQVLTYRQLADRAGSFAATLDRHAPGGRLPRTAVFGHRSLTAYASVLGALLRGHAYVPLNPAFPSDRTREMLARSGCDAVVVDQGALRQIDDVLAGLDRDLVVLAPEAQDVVDLAARWPRHRFLGAADLVPAPGADRAAAVGRVDPDAMAYLLFTSGSTGRPKGVMVAHRNATTFVDAMVERYAITEHDRFSQTFDLTFDLSVFDMFVCWERGACLVCPTQAQKSLPAKYVNDCGLTVWFSVPSTAVLMQRLRLLKPGMYPGLRWSLFCGEALMAETMQAFAAAAPNSICENLYGPTELTIACTLYRWDPKTSPAECHAGIVPIGHAYPGMTVRIVDAGLAVVPEGETGELLMAGPQVSLGYLDDAERTAAAFVVPPGADAVHYRTGDLVRRSAPEAPLVYLGRVDNQIKIQGYRVELGEVEEVVRTEAGVEVAVVLGWPMSAAGAEGLVGFVCGAGLDVAAVRQKVQKRLPAYMQLNEVRQVAEWPLNANGKIDRRALRGLLEARDAARTT